MSYIAESAGCFLCAGRDGKIYFRNIGQDEEQMPLKLFKTYKFGEEYKISRVAYEDGVRSFKFGDEARNTLWINQDNMYIVDEEQVENIYDKVKGLTINSFEGTTVINPALDIGDKITIDGKSIIYQGDLTLNGRFIADIKSKISIKQKQETTTKKESQTSINRRVQSEINQIDGTITQLVQEQTETTTKLTKVEQDIDSITQTVSSVEEQVDENNQSISQTNQKVTQIEQTVEGISQSVSNVEETMETVEQKADNAQSTADNINTNLTTNYYNKTETNSQIDQKANEITSTVSQTYSTKTETANAKNEAIESANSSTDEKLQDYSTTEEMNSAITQSATSITSEVNQTITNIQVGGTNAIRNSAPYNRDYWSSYNVTSATVEEDTEAKRNCMKVVLKAGQSGMYNSTTQYAKLEVGKEYSFSIWLKGSKALNVAVRYEGSAVANFNITTQWQKYSFTFTCLDSVRNFIVYAMNATAGDILYFHSLKLEEGNKITSWSPSPDDDVKEYEFGTKIEQNAKNVQVAWNNESQNIRIENDNGNSTMGFYDNNTKFAEMGVNNVDNDRYISFAVPCNYNQSIADGMAWGIQTPDGAFHPILFIKNFHMGAQQSDDVYGELALRFCDLVLEGIESGIKSGNIKMYGNALNGLVFESDDGSQILSINPPDSNIPEWENGGLNILGNIEFYKNQGGTCSLKMSNNNDDNCCLFTNDGIITANILQLEDITVWGDGTISGPINFYTIPKYQNNPLVYGRTNNVYTMWWVAGKLEFWIDNTNVTANISDKRLKSDIKDVDEDLIKAINELEYKQFKRDNKGGLIGVGIIAQDLAEKLEKYGKKTDDYEILQQFQYKTDDDTLYYEVEDKQFLLLRLMAKEQEIKELQEKVNNQDEIIQDLLARVEKLEKEVKINE